MTQKIIIKSYFVNKLVIRGEIIYLFDKEFLNPFILLIIQFVFQIFDLVSIFTVVKQIISIILQIYFIYTLKRYDM